MHVESSLSVSFSQVPLQMMAEEKGAHMGEHAMDDIRPDLLLGLPLIIFHVE